MVKEYNASDIDQFVNLLYRDVIVSRCNNLVKESNSVIIDDKYVTTINFECDDDIMNNIADNITEGVNKMLSRELNGLVSSIQIKSGEINYENKDDNDDIDYIKTDMENYREVKITFEPMNDNYKITED